MVKPKKTKKCDLSTFSKKEVSQILDRATSMIAISAMIQLMDKYLPKRGRGNGKPI